MRLTTLPLAALVVSLLSFNFVGGSFSQGLSPELKKCISDLKTLGASTDAALNACMNPSIKGIKTIQPSQKIGGYWVYQKPSNISNAQMKLAGAQFYNTTQACSIHFEFCTMFGGTWISKQSSLQIQESESVEQTTVTVVTPPVVVNSGPKTETEVYVALYQECLDRTMFRTLRSHGRATASNGYDMGFKFGRKPSNLTDEQMKEAGLRWEWGFQSWIGSQPQVKIPIASSAEASQQCRNELENAKL